jgi:hypothetical protein
MVLEQGKKAVADSTEMTVTKPHRDAGLLLPVHYNGVGSVQYTH